jgi:hypothetical protein
MTRRTRTGAYQGPAQLLAQSATLKCVADLESWVTIDEPGLPGLAGWSGDLTGQGLPPAHLAGGSLHLPDGRSGQVAVEKMSSPFWSPWTARVRGSGPPPF